MADWNLKFRPEYDYARSQLASDAGFERSWHPVLARLRKLMGEDGFDASEAAALDELRRLATHGSSQTRRPEDEGLLKAVNAWTDSPTGSVDDAERLRVAALKLLRHVYLLNKAGSRKVWIHSLPVSFNQWSTDAFWALGTAAPAVRAALRSSEEQFSEQDKRHLASATFQAMAWCQRACMVLSDAASSGAGRTAARALVRRWFAEADLAEAALDSHISSLDAGFKKVVALLGRGHFVLTDWVPLRGATAQADIKYLNAEAFTFASNGEGMDVVYIERSFFQDFASSVLQGQKNWTRIIVHELTHLAAGTEDVVNGETRYAHYGIQAHSGYPASQAVRNADNWAFFAGDCAAALTSSERTKALRLR